MLNKIPKVQGRSDDSSYITFKSVIHNLECKFSDEQLPILPEFYSIIN